MEKVTNILIQAGLLNEVQVQVAMHDQTIQPHLRLSEILALRGWIAEETVDFFELLWEMRLNQGDRTQIGQYLLEARLITEAQLEDILAEQRVSYLRFGEIAVLKGYVKQETIHFFVKHLFPHEVHVSKVSPLSRVTNPNFRRTMSSDQTLHQQEDEPPEPSPTQNRSHGGKTNRGNLADPQKVGFLGRVKRQVQEKITSTAKEDVPSPRRSPPRGGYTHQEAFSTCFDLSDADDVNFDEI